jgi:hypothetical protein
MLLRPNFTPMQWAWIIVGPVISIGAKVYEAWQMTTTLMGLPFWAYECFGLLIFFSAIVGLLIGYKRDIEERLSKKAESTVQPPAINAQPSIEFFPTIDDLRSHHPLHETFKPGNDIHAYFLSGEGVFAEYTDYIKCVKRLILPKPDASYLAILQTLPNSYADFKSQIIETRALASKNNIPVRLFDDFTGVSILFCNPDRPDGWVQLGFIIPCSESRNRPHFRLYKAAHERAVLDLYETFNQLWENSSKNTEEEDMQEGFEGATTDNRPILQVPITIEFNPENGKYFNQERRENSNVSVVPEIYREYYCTVFNDSDESLTNVSCEVEKIITIPNRPNDTQIEPENIHDKLHYDLDGFPVNRDFSPRRREKLWLFSRLTKALDDEPVRIVKGAKFFYDKKRQRQVFLRVTADNHAPKTFSVTCWVEDGNLRMTWIRPED